MQFASVVLSWRRLLAAATFGGGLVALALAFVLPAKYVGTVTFIAEVRPSTQVSSDLAGVAAQFGLGFPGAGRERSPEFYVALARSDRVLRELLTTKFRASNGAADSVSLMETLEIRGRGEGQRLERGVRKLYRRIAPSIDLRSSIITLEVEMPSPVLAAAVANWLVRHADTFNREVRRTQRRDHRRFVEERLALAERELSEAESALRTFLEQNRRFEQSPTKRFEEDQLARQVNIANEVYLTLRRELETARIEEHNDVPVLTVVDPAIPPERPAFPRPTRMLIFGMIVGLAGAASYVFLIEYLRLMGSRDPRGRTVVVEQLRGARSEVRRIARLRRRVPAGD
ncbi:MAG: GNVR domain-containing protein [Longimicrobiales bacterium]